MEQKKVEVKRERKIIGRGEERKDRGKWLSDRMRRFSVGAGQRIRMELCVRARLCWSSSEALRSAFPLAEAVKADHCGDAAKVCLCVCGCTSCACEPHKRELTL